MLQVRSSGEILDVKPRQEISLTFDNPFFETDHIPVALSTPIAFPLTEQICRVFQFAPAMLMAPGVKKLTAELLMNGACICRGSLLFDEYSDDGLSYTFIGAEFDETAAGKLSDLRWPDYLDVAFSTLVKNGRSGAYQDFGLPQIMRKDYAGTSEYRTSTDNNKYPDCSVTDKYANWLATDSPFVVPAVRVLRILEKIIPGVAIFGYDLNRLFDHLAILGLHKNKDVNNRFGVVGTSYPNRRPEAPPLRCSFDLGDTLPDMSSADFVVNLLKMTCSTLFCEGRNYYIRSNKDILASHQAIDWTDKVADSYSCVSQEGQGYSFSFQSTGDTYQTANPDDPSQLEESEETTALVEVHSMMEAISKVRASDDLISLRHVPTGDIISGWRQQAYLYYYLRGSSYNRTAWHTMKTAVPLTDVAHQSGFDPVELAAAPEAQTYDCAVAFQVPRCVPTEIYHTSTVAIDGSINMVVGLCSMTPVLDLPSIGGTRSDTVYIGLLLDNNFVDKGVYFTRPTAYIDPGSEVVSDLTLAIEGENGLYEKFHKEFAEWLQKPQNPRKVDLDLSATDISGLKLWNKYLMYNQEWLIKSLEILLDTSSDSIRSTAEIVPV